MKRTVIQAVIAIKKAGHKRGPKEEFYVLV
jgi:hypothetical protein